MTTFKGKNLERFITLWLSLFAMLFLLLNYVLLSQLALLTWQIVLITSSLTIACIYAIKVFRANVMCSFRRALLHLEAVRQEDYKQYAKAEFPTGIVGKFHHQLRNLSEDLAEKKKRYDQHAFLVYQLIDQLDTPVLVFNQKDQLTYANGAFSHLYEGQHWQMFRHVSSNMLGLVKDEGGWQLQSQEQQKKQQWQISQSSFIDAGIAHQLLVFTNIESAVRTSQVKAWQQMISVMGHEIRNSLTPVSSIAESLAERATNHRDKDALGLISERCLHLQDFINRYASLTKGIHLHYQHIITEQLAGRLKGLFNQQNLTILLKAKLIWADQSLLEQVLINLIKNAYEAGAKTVSLEFSEDKHKSCMKVVDDGHGFANPENAFVPLFSTKQDGQGIGLSFCRNIIEQHQGHIRLENNHGNGVTVQITLPLKIIKIQ
ncbi:sensor histidine kinase [Flocculibacter collagenilyticus]|uniref:sensor histidine kinase n=1 Tax=Flocculibacter collagenilyticus TaxID=2744479 RepID=UPI0018F5E5F2|nr:HAMP domain-containing sensor histidine kinase [Flocculibacter collagenilyticus]